VADTEITIVLERGADEFGDGVLAFLGQFLGGGSGIIQAAFLGVFFTGFLFWRIPKLERISL
jgi:hypothetical protein